jgi:hypothetical protein
VKIRPILTYGHEGLTRHGVNPEDHAVVYSSKQQGPRILAGEERLITKRPVRIDLDNPAHKLDPTSRLNYAKIYTVEHNVKVLFIGRVANKYKQEVTTTFNAAHPPLNSGSSHNAHQNNSPEQAFSHAHQTEPSYPVTDLPTSTGSEQSPVDHQYYSSSPAATTSRYSTIGAAGVAGVAGFALGVGSTVVYVASALPP